MDHGVTLQIKSWNMQETFLGYLPNAMLDHKVPDLNESMRFSNGSLMRHGMAQDHLTSTSTLFSMFQNNLEQRTEDRPPCSRVQLLPNQMVQQGTPGRISRVSGK